jgi:hypothetical protein
MQDAREPGVIEVDVIRFVVPRAFGQRALLESDEFAIIPNDEARQHEFAVDARELGHD